MPEMPEVETIRMDLESQLQRGRMGATKLHRADLRVPFPHNFAERLDGCVLESVGRRAKILLLNLDSGMTWVTHLGMTGHFVVLPIEADASTPSAVDPSKSKQLHFECVVTTASGRHWVGYYDQRRFGYMLLVPTPGIETQDWYSELGPEPLSNEFSGPVLVGAAKGRKADLKTLLTDQKVVAGIGNAYVCEALWAAELKPERQALTLTAEEADDLVAGIKNVLQDAIEAGEAALGTRDLTAGRNGYFEYAFKVYDNADAPCPRGDGGIIQRVADKGRSTFFCPVCQK